MRRSVGALASLTADSVHSPLNSCRLHTQRKAAVHPGSIRSKAATAVSDLINASARTHKQFSRLVLLQWNTSPESCRVLQGARMGNISCRMAHSCSPTCFTVTMGAGPQLTLAIYTTRAVAQVRHRGRAALHRQPCFIAQLLGQECPASLMRRCWTATALYWPPKGKAGCTGDR